MDGYSYMDIFETKGIEYLVIIAFLMLFIPFSLILNKKVSLAGEFRKAFHLFSDNVFNLSHGLFYSRHHTWTHLQGSGVARVGLDDLVLGLTGHMRITPLRSANEEIQKGAVLAELGLNGKRLRIFSPISGHIVRTNPAVSERANFALTGPSEQAWIYEIKPVNWKAETHSYYLAEEAAEWFKTELARLRDFFSTRISPYHPELSMAVLQDGGEIREDVMNDLPERFWSDFQREFLNPEENPGR